jgi:hypothetical protein
MRVEKRSLKSCHDCQQWFDGIKVCNALNVEVSSSMLDIVAPTWGARLVEKCLAEVVQQTLGFVASTARSFSAGKRYRKLIEQWQEMTFGRRMLQISKIARHFSLLWLFCLLT